jgi:uncharacterized protein (DUF1697 family)
LAGEQQVRLFFSCWLIYLHTAKQNRRILDEYYILLLRGINVGGKNKIPMEKLRHCFEENGYTNVATYIASGNVILNSDKQPSDIKNHIETLIPKYFTIDDDIIKVLVFTSLQLKTIIQNKPEKFGNQPYLYHSDVLFLMEIDSEQAMPYFSPREGVDKIWPGDGAVYSQRLSAQRTKSRLSKIINTPVYKSMTVRSWNTVLKLQEIAHKNESNE